MLIPDLQVALSDIGSHIIPSIRVYLGDEIVPALEQRFISPGAGWIKGLMLRVSSPLASGMVTVRVYKEAAQAASWVLTTIGDNEAYLIFDEASRVPVSLGDTIACKIITSSDFTLNSAGNMTSDVFFEFKDLAEAANP